MMRLIQEGEINYLQVQQLRTEFPLSAKQMHDPFCYCWSLSPFAGGSKYYLKLKHIIGLVKFWNEGRINVQRNMSTPSFTIYLPFIIFRSWSIFIIFLSIFLPTLHFMG